jgi:hypothetical protein
MISSILPLLRRVCHCSSSPSSFRLPLRSPHSPLGCALILSVGGSVCRCRSLPHPSPRRANHDCTNCITTDVLAHVRGTLVVDILPSSSLEWGVRVGVVAPTAPGQRAALVELYIATNGSTWSTGKTGWQNHATGSDPCDNSWSGVTCSGSSGSGNRNV